MALTTSLGLAEMILRIGRDLPFLRIGLTDDAPLVCVRRRGETIVDPDCEEDFEAITSGVFRRFASSNGNETGWRWMHVCAPFDEDVEGSLELLAGRPVDQALINEISLSIVASATLVKGNQRGTRAPSPR